MKEIYLRKPERPFNLWKWIVLGSLFLLTLNYVSSWLGDIEVMRLSIILGFMITVRMLGLRKLALGLRLLGGIGLCLAISSITSIGLWGICVLQTSLEFCTQNSLAAYTLANFMFSLGIVIIFVAVEILGSFGKTLSYVVHYWKR